jgi:hypothetical protein
LFVRFGGRWSRVRDGFQRFLGEATVSSSSKLSSQVSERDFEIVSKPSSSRLGMPKVAPKKSQREFLAQFFCQMVVPNDRTQILECGSTVTQKQFGLGTSAPIGFRLVRLLQ